MTTTIMRKDAKLDGPANPIQRICLLLPNLDGGGAELVVLRLAEGIIARGGKVDLLLGTLKGEHISKIPSGVTVKI